MFSRLVLAASLAFPALAFAEDDPVAARQALMKDIGAQLQVVGGMARGQTQLDPAAANAAFAKIHELSIAVPAAFETEADAPESEALPAIWASWDDFVAKADALRLTTDGLLIASEADLGPAMQALGAACSGCHQSYRE